MINKNYKPKRGSKRERLYQHILENPGATITSMSKLHIYDDPYMVLREVSILIGFEVVKEENGRYYQHTPEPEIITEVLIRQPMVFKPLNTFLPTESPRGQKIERRSFQTCQSKIKVQNPNGI